MLQKINHILSKPIIWLITLYQYTLSPDKGLPSLRLKGRVCAHEPHCSKYSIQVLKRYGFWPGIFYATERILHCTASMHKHYDPDHYRIVFFSSAPIGVPFLQHLAHDKRFEVVGIVTQCDKPSGRGLQVCENIIKECAKDITTLKHCEIKTPTKLHPEKSQEGREFAQRLASKKPDLLVVIAYGKIIPQQILDIPTIAPINIHGSLLPKYRGASPIQSTLLHNDKETGITIMKMDATMDTGNMIDILRFGIPFDWTTQQLIQKMQTIGPKFLNDTLRKYAKKFLGEVKQNENKATYCNKIEKESGLIDPRNDSIETIYNKYRAFFLRPKIYFILNGKRVIIESLQLDEPIYNSNDELPLIIDQKLHPAITHIQLKPEGKQAMDWKQFVNGYIQ